MALGSTTEQTRRIFLNQQPAKEQIAAPHLVLCSGISSPSLPGLLLLCIHNLLLLLYPSSFLLFCLSLAFLSVSLSEAPLLNPSFVFSLHFLSPSSLLFFPLPNHFLTSSGSFPAFSAFLFPFPPCLANTFISLCL